MLSAGQSVFFFFHSFTFLPCLRKKRYEKSRPVMQRFHHLIGYWLTGGFPFYLFVFYIQALKVLRTAEYAPLVVFIAAPSMSALAELRSSINVSHPSYHNKTDKQKQKKQKYHTYCTTFAQR